jgi:hypothetical protein
MACWTRNWLIMYIPLCFLAFQLSCIVDVYIPSGIIYLCFVLSNYEFVGTKFAIVVSLIVCNQNTYYIIIKYVECHQIHLLIFLGF